MVTSLEKTLVEEFQTNGMNATVKLINWLEDQDEIKNLGFQPIPRGILMRLKIKQKGKVVTLVFQGVA